MSDQSSTFIEWLAVEGELRVVERELQDELRETALKLRLPQAESVRAYAQTLRDRSHALLCLVLIEQAELALQLHHRHARKPASR